MDTKGLIEEVYAAFNRRDVDAVFACMGNGVSWPKASEGGRVVGKEEIRAYWGRQWSEFDPFVYPQEVIEDGGKVRVRVRQLVKSLNGEVLADGEVWHVYTMVDGLIECMEIGGAGAGAEEGPSAAFAHR
jgi:hypothetical protein